MKAQCTTIYCINLMHNFLFVFFFFNDTATTEIYTLSLHDALPISRETHQTLVICYTLEKTRNTSTMKEIDIMET